MTTAPIRTLGLPLPALAATRKVGLAIGASLLLAISAQISVAVWPVPATMQSLAVVLIGAALGWRLAAAAVLLYLAQGAMGLPVFAHLSAGPAVFAGPTGGYLLAFPLVAALAGWLASVGMTRTFPRAFVSSLLCTTLILFVGALWLGALFPQIDAFTAGFAMFLPGALLKSLLAAAILAAPRRRA